jgi:hypothetical protein
VVPANSLLAALVTGCVATVALSACSAKPPATANHPDTGGSEAAYLAPPSVNAARSEAGNVVLGGAR